MADDTRQPPEATSPRPSRAPANIMPGGTAHTAGGQRPEAESLTYFEVVRQLPAGYYLNFHKRPCVRDSQLTGISSGFVAGFLGAIVRSTSFPGFYDFGRPN